MKVLLVLLVFLSAPAFAQSSGSSPSPAEASKNVSAQGIGTERGKALSATDEQFPPRDLTKEPTKREKAQIAHQRQTSRSLRAAKGAGIGGLVGSAFFLSANTAYVFLTDSFPSFALLLGTFSLAVACAFSGGYIGALGLSSGKRILVSLAAASSYFVGTFVGIAAGYYALTQLPLNPGSDVFPAGYFTNDSANALFVLGAVASSVAGSALGAYGMSAWVQAFDAPLSE